MAILFEISRFTPISESIVANDQVMEAALDLGGQININMILINKVWGFQNGVKIHFGSLTIFNVQVSFRRSLKIFALVQSH